MPRCAACHWKQLCPAFATPNSSKCIAPITTVPSVRKCKGYVLDDEEQNITTNHRGDPPRKTPVLTSRHPTGTLEPSTVTLGRTKAPCNTLGLPTNTYGADRACHRKSRRPDPIRVLTPCHIWHGSSWLIAPSRTPAAQLSAQPPPPPPPPPQPGALPRDPLQHQPQPQGGA